MPRHPFCFRGKKSMSEVLFGWAFCAGLLTAVTGATVLAAGRVFKAVERRGREWQEVHRARQTAHRMHPRHPPARRARVVVATPRPGRPAGHNPVAQLPALHDDLRPRPRPRSERASEPSSTLPRVTVRHRVNPARTRAKLKRETLRNAQQRGAR